MVGKLAGGSLNPLGISLGKVRGFIDQARNLINTPPLGGLTSLAMGGFGRLLASRGGFESGRGQGCPESQLESGRGQGCPESQLESGRRQGCSGSELESGLRTRQLSRHVGSALRNGVSRFGSRLRQATDQLTGRASRFLSGVTSRVRSFVSGRAGMRIALQSSACGSEWLSGYMPILCLISCLPVPH